MSVNLFLAFIQENTIEKHAHECHLHQLSKLHTLEIMSYMHRHLFVTLGHTHESKQELINKTSFVLETLENVLFFEQNIFLYKKTFDMVIHLNNRFQSFVTLENYYYILVACSLLIHKYYIDCEFNNADICQFFQIDSSVLLNYECAVLAKFNFALPIHLDFPMDNSPAETQLKVKKCLSRKKRKLRFTHIKKKKNKTQN